MEKNALSFVLGCVPALLSGMGTEHTMNIILLVLGILSASISVGMSIASIVAKFIAWRKKAKEDGIITEEELNALLHDVEPDIRDIKEKADEIAQKGKEKKQK